MISVAYPGGGSSTAKGVPVRLAEGEAPALRVGQTIQARVIALLSDAGVRLAGGGGQFDARLPVPLPLGAAVELVVEAQGALPRLVLVGARAAGKTLFPPAAAAARNFAGTAPGSRAAGVPQSRGAAPGVSVEGESPAPMRSASTALVDPAPRGDSRGGGERQGGGSGLEAGRILMARVAETLADGRVRLVSGDRQLVARLPVSLPEGARLRLEVVRGGALPELVVLPEDGGGKAARGAGRIVEEGGQAPARREVLRRAAQRDAGAQGGLARLFADLAAVAAKPPQGFPEVALRAVAHLLGLRLSGTKPVVGEAVRQAVSSSGIFHEAGLARGAGVGDGGNLKNGLLALRLALGDPPAPDAAGMAGGGDVPRPPERGRLPQAEAPKPASLTQDMAAEEVAQRLRSETDAALARLRLSQVASLPEVMEGGRGRGEGAHTVWSFEIPLALAQGTAILQFLVERDGSAADQAGDTVWKLAFSIDLEPVGPVHAQLRLRGARIAATLWAERAETAESFRRRLDDLRRMLAEGAVEIGDIQVRAGRPRDRGPARAGRFVDRNS